MANFFYNYPLRTDIFCIDEVFLDTDEHCKYALVIQNFHTGAHRPTSESSQKNVIESYFANLPLEETSDVKYVNTLSLTYITNI